MYFNLNKLIVMRKNERNVLIASGIGLFAVFGIFAARKFLKLDFNHQESQKVLSDIQRHSDHSDDQHGVEYYSVL